MTNVNAGNEKNFMREPNIPSNCLSPCNFKNSSFNPIYCVQYSATWSYIDNGLMVLLKVYENGFNPTFYLS